MEIGTLLIIATPIGNLGDLTPRALEAIKSCDYLVSENPMITKKLLSVYDVHKTVYWYREGNHKGAAKIIISDLVEKGVTIGVLSDAGTPVVSDPGSKLLKEAYEAGIKVVPIPGVSAVTTAVSAFPVTSAKFLFWGFAPRKEGEWTKMILGNKEFLLKEKISIVAFESPFRLKKSLGYLEKLSHELETESIDLMVGLGKEMTKKFESYVYNTPSAILAAENPDFKLDKGEATLVIMLKKRKNRDNE